MAHLCFHTNQQQQQLHLRRRQQTEEEKTACEREAYNPYPQWSEWNNSQAGRTHSANSNISLFPEKNN